MWQERGALQFAGNYFNINSSSLLSYHSLIPQLFSTYSTIYYYTIYIVHWYNDRKRGGRDWVFPRAGRAASREFPRSWPASLRKNPVPPDSFPFINIVYYIEVLYWDRIGRKQIHLHPTSTGMWMDLPSSNPYPVEVGMEWNFQSYPSRGGLHNKMYPLLGNGNWQYIFIV